MKKKIAILAVYMSLAGLSANAKLLKPQETEEYIPPKPVLITEGFLFNGTDGTITRSEDKKTWVFIADEDITDGRAIIKAGDPLDLLPSSMLAKITGQADDDYTAGIKLWARITRYDDRNLLFCWYYIPMTDDSDKPETEPNDRQPDEQPQIENDDDEDSIIPKNVMAILKPKRVVNLAKLRKVVEAEGNAMLAERTGFIIEQDGQKILKIDSLGRNVDEMSFKLLGNEVLKWTELKIEKSPHPLRFRIAGIVTKYNGQYYILLQRATRAYNHGNFVR
ncbi:MAG: hypothetical protein KAJ07_06225 [Planctomycetes bacterium]|nr:hypothetical protein [Planctomycetota bacterium]